jgi:hypothetical protein
MNTPASLLARQPVFMFSSIMLLLALLPVNARAQTNTKLGTNAGFSITTGVDDTAIGNLALRLNTSGSSNTAVGSLALSSNVVGANNTALGFGALQFNLASFNTAVGRVALYSNTTGTNNVAFGNATMYATTTGSLNTGFGTQSLRLNTTGSSNVAIGYQSLYSNVSGSFNTALGDGALFNNTGTGNIGIGDDGGYNLTTGSNNIYIGNPGGVPGGGTATESGNIRIGYTKNGAVGLHTDTYLAGVIHGNGSALTGVIVPDNTITSAKIADGAVGVGKLGVGAVTAGNVAAGAISTGNLAAGAAASGQVLGFDGTNLTWTTPASGIWSVNGTGYPYFNGGFVGIGTSSPAASLHIVNGSGNMLRLDGAIPHINFIDTGNANTLTGIGAQAGSFYVSNNQTGVLMQLTATGFLGLGTSTPQSRLHVVSGTADTLRMTGPTPYLTFENTTANFISRIQANGAGMDFKTNGAAINNHPGIIHLDGVGTVGLGTTTPKHQLSIKYFAGGPTWTSNGWIGAIDVDNASAIAWGANSAGQRFGMGHTNGSFAMWRTASDPGTTGSPATYDFVITDAGNVGIGTTGPATKLEIVGAQHALGMTGFGPDVTFKDTGNGSARNVIQSVGGTLNFFTESYMSGSNTNNYAQLANTGIFSVKALTIRGGADLAEPFQMKEEEELEKGSVVVIDDEHPGRLRRSSTAYDTRVAGIVSGANGVNPGIALHQEGALEGGQNVALSGRVYVRADTSGGAIRPGDLLTTSDTPGHAMKVTDFTKAQGAVIGKAMSALEDGAGMVLVLVSLQ